MEDAIAILPTPFPKPISPPWSQAGTRIRQNQTPSPTVYPQHYISSKCHYCGTKQTSGTAPWEEAMKFHSIIWDISYSSLSGRRVSRGWCRSTQANRNIGRKCQETPLPPNTMPWIKNKKQRFDIKGANEFSILICKRKLGHVQNAEVFPVPFTVFLGTSRDRREWKERESHRWNSATSRKAAFFSPMNIGEWWQTLLHTPPHRCAPPQW